MTSEEKKHWEQVFKEVNENLRESNEELRKKRCEDIKWKIIFRLTEDYRETRIFTPIGYETIMKIAPTTEEEAKEMAEDINDLMRSYIEAKETLANDPEFHLDGFDDDVPKKRI